MTFLFDLFVSDLWPGVPAGLRPPLAAAVGSDHHPGSSAEHPTALLSREPTLPPHRPQQGGGGTKRSDIVDRVRHKVHLHSSDIVRFKKEQLKGFSYITFSKCYCVLFFMYISLSFYH